MNVMVSFLIVLATVQAVCILVLLTFNSKQCDLPDKKYFDSLRDSYISFIKWKMNHEKS